jgi:glyoxylase-like metal-dependent hydrolase (beta-lactamase superfamily II)
MLKQVATNVLVHESAFIQSNAVVVQGAAGVLLVDPGITSSELAGLAKDIQALGQPLVAGFSTHPDWDHVLWHSGFGDVPRYGTAKGAAAMHDFLAHADWKAQLHDFLPEEHIDEISLDELFGRITGLPAGTTHLPWDGPAIRIIEHRAHAKGHAALLIEAHGVLIAGDMLSDTLIPFLDFESSDPAGDYLTALQLFADVADDVSVVIPGHGTVGDAQAFRTRLELDRTYVQALLDGTIPDDPRVGPTAVHPWLADMPAWQLQQLGTAK